MSEMIFLGTGAADWNLAMKNEGFFRRNSSCLIDKKLLIDPGAHIFSFIEDFNVPDLFDELTDIIVTHFHSDHINKESVLRLAENRIGNLRCLSGRCSGKQRHYPRYDYEQLPVDSAGLENR